MNELPIPIQNQAEGQDQRPSWICWMKSGWHYLVLCREGALQGGRALAG